MSRVSLGRRIDRLRDTILPPGSLAWRVDRLDDDLAALHRTWHKDVSDIISRAQNEGGPGAAYAALLDGKLDLPTMPRSVEQALWPDGRSDGSLPADISLGAASRRYADLIDGDEQ